MSASAPTPVASFLFPPPKFALAGDGASTFNVDDLLPFSPHLLGYKSPRASPSISPTRPLQSRHQAAGITRRSAVAPPPSSPHSGRLRRSPLLPLVPSFLSHSCASRWSLTFLFGAAKPPFPGARRRLPQQPRRPTAGRLPRRRHPRQRPPHATPHLREVFLEPETHRSAIFPSPEPRRRRRAISSGKPQGVGVVFICCETVSLTNR